MGVVKNYRIAGTSHYIDNIMSLSIKNDDYKLSKKALVDEGLEGERIYQYEFYPVKTQLIPEPNNPIDPKAIKVITDNVHIGYIKSGSCSHVLKLLNENRIEKIECTISGGKYKYVRYDEDDDSYVLEKSDIPFFAELRITESK